MSQMLLAQGLGEYGVLAGGKGVSDEGSSSFRDAVAAVEEFFRDATPAQWAMIGFGLFLLWFIFLRRKR